MKAVLDANVFVSAAIASRGTPARVLDAWRAGCFSLVISAGILGEITGVLCRPSIRARHQWDQEQVVSFLAGLGELAIVVPGELQVEAIAEDPDGDIVLACALEGEADYIVSGDQHLLKLKAFQGVQTVTPAQFLEILGRQGEPPF